MNNLGDMYQIYFLAIAPEKKKEAVLELSRTASFTFCSKTYYYSALFLL